MARVVSVIAGRTSFSYETKEPPYCSVKKKRKDRLL